MKKILLLIAIMLGAVGAWAQNSEFAATLKKANANLPAVITDGMTLNSVAEVNNNIIFSYTLDDEVFESLQSMQDILRDAMVAEIVSSPDPMNKELVAKCKQLNVSIVQKFTNSKDEKIEIIITPKDMN